MRDLEDNLFRALVSIKGILIDDDKVALALNQRREWELPGGKMEVGETLEDALIRECREELGILVSAGRVVDAFKHHRFENIVVVVLGCTSADTEFTLSEEHSRAQWFAVSDLDRLNVPERQRSAITKWIQGGSR